MTNHALNKSEFAIMIILRVIGVTGLFALPAIFLPFAWMDAIHKLLGLGDMPDVPIVHYLARSLSAFYTFVSAVTLFISIDVRRHRDLIRLWAWLVIAIGTFLMAIDLSAGMPLLWTISEGPPTLVVGIIVLLLARHARAR